MRFTVTFTDDEASKLMEIMAWFEMKNGIQVSKNRLIKSLLFGAYDERVMGTRRQEMHCETF